VHSGGELESCVVFLGDIGCGVDFGVAGRGVLGGGVGTRGIGGGVCGVSISSEVRAGLPRPDSLSNKAFQIYAVNRALCLDYITGRNSSMEWLVCSCVCPVWCSGQN
jgi:hypothetical protein